MEELLKEKRVKEILISLYNSPKSITDLFFEVRGSLTTIESKLDKLIANNLVKEEISKKYPSRRVQRILSLTEKGKEIAKYILMTEKIFKKQEIEEVKEIPIDRKKWILLLLYLANEIKGTTRLMKYLFLMKKEFNIDNEYKFIPYLYGPCSFEVFEDIGKLRKIGLIEIDNEIYEPEKAGDWQIITKYKLTEKGKEFSEKIYNELNDENKLKLKKLLEKFSKYTLIELLHYVYHNYPEESKGIE
jgi:DNA-binding MarR family transcriptional regulator